MNFGEPKAYVTDTFASIRKDLSATAELKRCDPKALRDYATGRLGQFVNMNHLLDRATAAPLKKTPAQFLTVPPKFKTPDMSGDPAANERALEKSKTDFAAAQAQYEKSQTERIQAFTEFVAADNAAALQTLCQADKLAVVNTKSDGPVSAALIELSAESGAKSDARADAKAGGKTRLQLLFVRAWTDWITGDFLYAGEWLSDRYARRFGPVVEAKGLPGLLAHLKEINAQAR